MPVLTLIRGLPGSGKSTLARTLAKGQVTPHYEADQFHIKDGRYQFRPENVKYAHMVCQAKAAEALQKGLSVVIANTFTTNAEMQPYFEMAEQFGAEVQVIEVTGPWKNTHDVPDDVLKAMRDRWEPLDASLIP